MHNDCLIFIGKIVQVVLRLMETIIGTEMIIVAAIGQVLQQEHIALQVQPEIIAQNSITIRHRQDLQAL